MEYKKLGVLPIVLFALVFQMCNVSTKSDEYTMSQEVEEILEQKKEELQAKNYNIILLDNENNDSVKIDVTIIEPKRLPDLGVDLKKSAKDIAEIVYKDIEKLYLVSGINVSFIREAGLSEPFWVNKYSFTLDDFVVQKFSKFIEFYTQTLYAKDIHVKTDSIDNTDSINVKVVVFDPQRLPELNVDKKSKAQAMASELYNDFDSNYLLAKIVVSFVFEEGALCEAFDSYNYEFTSEDL